MDCDLSMGEGNLILKTLFQEERFMYWLRKDGLPSSLVRRLLRNELQVWVQSQFESPSRSGQRSARPARCRGFLWGQIPHRLTASHPTTLPSLRAAEPRSWSPRSQGCPSTQGCFPSSFRLTRGREKTNSPGWMAPRRGLLPREALAGGQGVSPTSTRLSGDIPYPPGLAAVGRKMQLGSVLPPPWLSSSGACQHPGGSAGS